MRLKVAKLVLTVLFLLLGLALLGVAIFAYQLGLDHTPSWGKSRIVMAGLGSLLLIGALTLQTGWLVWRHPSFQHWVTRWQALANTISHSKPAQWAQVAQRDAALNLDRFPPTAYFRRSPRRSALLFAGLGVGIVLLVDLWYLTSGTLTVWTPYTSYFDKLANAFSVGQVALLEQPPAELLALENPYDYRNRTGFGYLWDVSLYQGKYYYYWGAVPALVALPAKLLSGPATVIEDQHLLFFFTSGLILMVALLLIRLRSVFFSTAPPWTLLPFVLLAGLALPVLWLVNRPSVYEVAIAGGQFFLFVGLVAAFQALTQPSPSKGWLLVTGLAWGAAINCRLNLALAVAFFCLMLAWRVFQIQKEMPRRLAILAGLAFPLVLWAGAMAWYNFARFGNILETGHRYQLTGLALTGNYQDTISAAYILPSLYSYLIRPLQFVSHDFPFVFAPFIQEKMWPWWIRLPKAYYYPEPVAGLLSAIPALWTVFLPMLEWVRRGWSWLNERRPVADPQPDRSGLWIWMTGGAVCLLAPLLVFITSSMRYLADVVPFLVILAALGYWKGRQFWRDRPGLRCLLTGMVMGLIFVSILFSLLVNFQVGDKRFETNNPALYHAIAHFFQTNTP